ncbi:HTH_Tnp_Tc3_2 domain-containing protein [Trichonephila clavipes]|nr:HTH_Tnp_Tc3_2 domain-containing protein [Trichonephila clavipes]
MACEVKLLESEATTGFFVLLREQGNKAVLDWVMKEGLIPSRDMNVRRICVWLNERVRLMVLNGVVEYSRKRIPSLFVGVQGYLRMSQQHDLPESMAWRVISRLESGQTQRSVAHAVGVARSVVARLWNRFQETGNVRRRPGAGRPRSTTSTDDRYIQLTARRNRTENAT